MRFVYLLILFSFAACGDDSSPKNASTTNNTTDAGQTDSTSDVTETPVVMCPDEGEIFCEGKCVNGQISVDHCGKCGNTCQAGAQTCRAGSCQCLNGRDMCGNLCYDLTSNHDRCGRCDIQCEETESCVDSECIFVNDRQEVIDVLKFTNIKRSTQQDCGVYGTKNAVAPLQLNALLTVAAQGHAEDMAAHSFFDHIAPDGSGPADRATRAGYDWSMIGENIARGQDSPRAAVQGWTDSDDHCTNMMNGNFTELGVGYAISNDNTKYWVQLFGKP